MCAAGLRSVAFSQCRSARKHRSIRTRPLTTAQRLPAALRGARCARCTRCGRGSRAEDTSLGAAAPRRPPGPGLGRPCPTEQQRELRGGDGLPARARSAPAFSSHRPGGQSRSPAACSQLLHASLGGLRGQCNLRLETKGEQSLGRS